MGLPTIEEINRALSDWDFIDHDTDAELGCGYPRYHQSPPKYYQSWSKGQRYLHVDRYSHDIFFHCIKDEPRYAYCLTFPAASSRIAQSKLGHIDLAINRDYLGLLGLVDLNISWHLNDSYCSYMVFENGATWTTTVYGREGEEGSFTDMTLLTDSRSLIIDVAMGL